MRRVKRVRPETDHQVPTIVHRLGVTDPGFQVSPFSKMEGKLESKLLTSIAENEVLCDLVIFTDDEETFFVLSVAL